MLTSSFECLSAIQTDHKVLTSLQEADSPTAKPHDSRILETARREGRPAESERAAAAQDRPYIAGFREILESPQLRPRLCRRRRTAQVGLERRQDWQITLCRCRAGRFVPRHRQRRDLAAGLRDLPRPELQPGGGRQAGSGPISALESTASQRPSAPLMSAGPVCGTASAIPDPASAAISRSSSTVSALALKRRSPLATRSSS